ncbi:MAG: glycosyltransferase family 2 protein [Chthonomonas sp.]|nr:glycosyltransferase family 2 protein [Chthonomonas sp.]
MSPSIIERIAATLSPDVSVLVPALNEQDTIREVIDRLLAVPLDLEVIVVNDGSTDGTAAILTEYGGQIKLVTHLTKSGKGRAIRSGLEVASGRVVVIQDADLEYFPEEIPALVAPILEGRSKVVYGTRFSGGYPKGMALPNKIVNWGLALASRLLYGQKITDEATCYKAVETNLLKSLALQCTGFEFCPEVTAKVSRVGQRIAEIPIRYVPRNKMAGKKIRWTDAPIAFWTLLKYRFWKRP